MKNTQAVVIGDGWAALFLAGFLARAEKEVTWLSNSGARVLPALPVLEAGPGAQAWLGLAEKLGITEADAATEGSFVREFRNKAFREASWAREETLDARREARDSSLWAPETRFVPLSEIRPAMDLCVLDEALRAKVLALPGITRIDGVPVIGIEGASGGCTIELGSGEKISAERVYFADKWSLCSSIEGLPKPLQFAKNRER